MSPQENDPQIEHCIAKIRQLVGTGDSQRRAVLQLGYNLGRLSELNGQGRAIWDDWKSAVETWNVEQLAQLAARLDSSLRTVDPGPNSP